MRRSPASALCLFALCSALAFEAAPATAQKDKDKAKDIKEVDLEGFNFKFAVPAGWKVVKLEKDTDGTWICILQDSATRGKVKSTIGVWAGTKYLKETPDGLGLEKGNKIVASITASLRAGAWALGTPEKLPALPKEGVTSSNDKDFASATVRVRGVSAYGLATDKKGGEITLGFASDPAAYERTKKVLTDMLKK